MSKIDELAKDFLSQKNIAVAGVSKNEKATANFIYQQLNDANHKVYPINPTMEKFNGEPCYPDVKSVPVKIDGVVIVTKPEVTEKIVQDCIDAGIKRVWMHNMFGNKGYNKAGTCVSEKAIQMCKENNITVIPGGCPVMFYEADFGHKCMRGITRLIGGFNFK